MATIIPLDKLLMKQLWMGLQMTDNQIIIDGCNVANCKYYVENNGVEYQGVYQYYDMCYKLPYDNCFNKRFCWHKIISRIKRIFGYGK